MALAALVQKQAELLETGLDAGAADVQGAGDGSDGGPLGPRGDEVDVFEGTRGPAALAQAAPGGERPGSGLVVDFSGLAELVEALARGRLGDAELAGDLSQGERAAASPPLPAAQQLQRVDGGHRTAPARSRGAGGGCHAHLRFLRLMRLRAGLGGWWR